MLSSATSTPPSTSPSTFIVLYTINTKFNNVDEWFEGDLAGAHGGRLLGRGTLQDTEEDTYGAFACENVASTIAECSVLGHPQKLQNQSYTQLLYAQSQVHAGLIR